MCIQASTNAEDFELNRKTIFPVMDKEIDVMIKTKALWNRRIENLQKLTKPLTLSEATGEELDEIGKLVKVERDND